MREVIGSDTEEVNIFQQGGNGESRGWIVPIGGAENKENDRKILKRFESRVTPESTEVAQAIEAALAAK